MTRASESREGRKRTKIRRRSIYVWGRRKEEENECRVQPKKRSGRNSFGTIVKSIMTAAAEEGGRIDDERAAMSSSYTLHLRLRTQRERRPIHAVA